MTAPKLKADPPAPTPPLSAGTRFWHAFLNVAERTGATFAEAFVSLFVLSSALNVSAAAAAAIAAIPAGLAVLTNALAAWLATDQPVKPTWLDYAERVGATFLQTFLGALILAHHYGLSELQVAAAAGLAAALSIVKGGLAQLTGSKTPAMFGPLALRKAA